MSIEAMKQAQQVKPVAWRTFDGEGGYDYRTYDTNENYSDEWDKRNPKHKGWVEPLYTTPPQRKKPEQEPVAFEKTVCPFCTSEWVTAEQHDRNVDRVEQEPVAKPKLIGWRTENFLWETADIKKAQNWEPNIGVLPIFEGDPNTQLTTPPQRKPLTDEEILKRYDEYVVELQNVIGFARAIEAAHGIGSNDAA